MKTFNEMIVVTVTPYSGTTTPDKNGLMPVMLQCIAGKMPNRNVLAGTVAERAGFEVGKTYLVQVREQGEDKVFGKAYSFVKVSELDGLQAVDAAKKIGPAEIFTVERPEGFEEAYERKGDAVESLQTKRIREGQFIPVNRTSHDHKTASDIKEGSTITDANKFQRLKDKDLEKKAIDKE